MTTNAISKHAMKAKYDVVVIGSGFGGAITASRLAQAGQSVAMLERGRRWEAGDFPRTTGQVSGAFWQDRKHHGLLEYRAFKRIDVLQGAGVGGGSLVYFNVHLRPPARIFESGRWPARITSSVMEPYYDLVQESLDSRPLRPPAGRQLPPRSQVFIDAAKRAGHNPELVDIAVYTGSERRHGPGHVEQEACTYCGSCLLGCHVHAKSTLDITYIAHAEQKHGLEVFPLHVVESIEPVPGRGYRVSFRRLDPDEPGGTPAEGAVIGKRVIVAAGALGSTELLLRCRDRHETLPRLSSRLGHWFSGNGDLLGPGTADTRAMVDPGQGPSITAHFTHDSGDDIITIEDLGIPDQFFWFLEGALPPQTSRLRGLLGLASSYVLQSMGIALRKSRVSNQIDALAAGGRTPRFLPYLGMGTDAANGRMRLRKDAIDIAWSHKESRKMFAQMERLLQQLSTAAGGRYATSPLWRWPFRKLLTAHPLGGCVLGDDPERSVVDHHGEVWGYPGLYVVDGASVPSALAVNPSLTIGALAERAAFWMLHEREMGSDDIARPAHLGNRAVPSDIVSPDALVTHARRIARSRAAARADPQRSPGGSGPAVAGPDQATRSGAMSHRGLI